MFSPQKHLDKTVALSVFTPTISRWIDGFLLAKQAEGLAKGTLRLYRLHLRRFASHCEDRGIAQLVSVDPSLLREYMLDLTERHNEGGRHIHYRVIKTFLFWFEGEAAPDGWRNPIKKCPPPKVPERILEAIDLADVSRLIAVADTRDASIFITLVDTGLRAAEICALQLADVDIVTGGLIVQRGKGGKARQVFLGKPGRRALRAYLRERGELAGPLYLARNKGFAYMGLRSLLKRRANQAGISPAPSLHSFRRACALSLLRSGVDLLSISRLLGHSDLSVLKFYIRQNSEDLRLSHEAHSPADRV